MSRRLVVATACVALALGAVAPATAAPKPVKGSYDVNLPPNPTLQATGELGDGCDTSPITSGTDDHPFKVPGAGSLAIVLDSTSPVGQQIGIDWDLWLLDGSREVLAGSHGATAHEEVTVKFKKATDVIIQVCNLSGAPSAKVTFTFTPKK